MKKIFVLVLSIWVINVIKAIVIVNKGAWVFNDVTITEINEAEDNIFHEYRFKRQVTKDNDFVIHYFITPESSSVITVNGTTRFCQADVSTLDGTVAAIAAKTLGLDVVDNTPCPVKAGLSVAQWSYVQMEQANVDKLFDNGESQFELLMIVYDEDWGIVVDVVTDERGSEYLDSLNALIEENF